MLPFRDYNPARTFPLVTISLIVFNILVYLYMFGLGQQSAAVLNNFVLHAAVIPAQYVAFFEGKNPGPGAFQPVLLTTFTAMFMHGGWLHLLGNMLYLWIFGNNIEDIMGPVRFLVFYLLCGVLATAAYIGITLAYMPPEAARVPALGASGAIAGVLGAYLVRFPRAQIDSCLFILIFITVVRLPAYIVLAGWFILQLFQGVASILPGQQAQSGGVAFWAHIGGFVAGMVLLFLFQKRQPQYEYWH